MGARRYENFSSSVEKYFTSERSKQVKYFSTREEKFRMSKRSCNRESGVRRGGLFREKNKIISGIWRFCRKSGDSGFFSGKYDVVLGHCC